MGPCIASQYTLSKCNRFSNPPAVRHSDDREQISGRQVYLCLQCQTSFKRPCTKIAFLPPACDCRFHRFAAETLRRNYLPHEGQNGYCRKGQYSSCSFHAALLRNTVSHAPSRCSAILALPVSLVFAACLLRLKPRDSTPSKLLYHFSLQHDRHSVTGQTACQR